MRWPCTVPSDLNYNTSRISLYIFSWALALSPSFHLIFFHHFHPVQIHSIFPHTFYLHAPITLVHFLLNHEKINTLIKRMLHDIYICRYLNIGIEITRSYCISAKFIDFDISQNVYGKGFINQSGRVTKLYIIHMRDSTKHKFHPWLDFPAVNTGSAKCL